MVDTCSQSFFSTEKGATSTDHGITLQEVAAQAGIDNLDIFDRECSQKMLLNLAKHCVDWKYIGLYLDLTEADIVDVDEGNWTADMKKVRMLGRWKVIFAHKATYRVFIEALLACGRAEDAVDACKTIAKGQCKLVFDSVYLVEYDYQLQLSESGILRIALQPTPTHFY